MILKETLSKIHWSQWKQLSVLFHLKIKRIGHQIIQVNFTKLGSRFFLKCSPSIKAILDLDKFYLTILIRLIQEMMKVLNLKMRELERDIILKIKRVSQQRLAKTIYKNNYKIIKEFYNSHQLRKIILLWNSLRKSGKH